MRKTAIELAEAFSHHIASGRYSIGDSLPSCRQAAEDFGVDKSTVSRAYKILRSQGLVRAVRGKGILVVDRSSAKLADADLQESMRALVWRAKTLGIPHDRVWQSVGEAVWDIYGKLSTEVAFIECNADEAVEWGQKLSRQLNLPIQPLVLADFAADPVSFLNKYGVIATTFYHLAAVTAAAGPEAERVVAVQALPVMDDALRIAQISAGCKVGVICTTEPAISTLNNFVRTYNANIEITPCLASNADELAGVIARSDVIVDTTTSHNHVVGLNPLVRVITVSFALDEQSIGYARRRILEMLKPGVAYSRHMSDRAAT